MATINYSGSQDVTGCTITTWTGATYYSFKLTQDCKISISGTPAINARAGDEFVIQSGEPYIFDRDTKVMLAYPDPTEESVQLASYSASTTYNHVVYVAGTYIPLAVINTVGALTSYTLTANVLISNINSNTRTKTIRIVTSGGTVLATESHSMPGSSLDMYSINAALTTSLSANETLTLEMYGDTVNDSAAGNRIPITLELIET